MLRFSEADARHAAFYAARLAARGVAFGRERPTEAVEAFREDWPQLEIAFRRSAEAAASGNLAAARTCMEFVTGPGLWLLDVLRPVPERLEWLAHGASAAELLGDDEALVSILNNIGIARLAIGEPQRALEFHRRGRRIAGRLGRRREVVHSMSSMGICYRHLGQRRKALAAHRQALTLAEEEVGLDDLRLNCLGNIAVIQAELGDPSTAIAGFQAVVDLAKKLGRRREEGYALGNLGRAHCELGQFAKAAELHAQDLEIARELDNKRGISNALGELGNARLALGHSVDAMRCHEEQVECAKSLAQPRELANALLNLACTLVHVARPEEARAMFERASEIFGDMGNQVARIEASTRMAGAYEAAGASASATTLLEEAIRLAQEYRIPGVRKLRMRVRMLAEPGAELRRLMPEQQGQNAAVGSGCDADQVSARGLDQT